MARRKKLTQSTLGTLEEFAAEESPLDKEERTMSVENLSDVEREAADKIVGILEPFSQERRVCILASASILPVPTDTPETVTKKANLARYVLGRLASGD